MTDDRDPVLTRLFAEQGTPANGSDFMTLVINRLERDRRSRRAYRIGAIIGGMIVAALFAPWIAWLAATAVGSLAAGISATQSLLDFKIGWLVACSIAASFLP